MTARRSVRRSRRGGFTLAEVTVAAVVVAALATSVVWSGPAQVQAIVRSHEETVALRVATARLEALRAADWATGRASSSGAAGGVPAVASAPARASVPALAPGERAFAIDGLGPGELPAALARETVTAAGDGLAEVAVEVTWDAADGGRGRVRLVTLVAEEAAR